MLNNDGHIAGRYIGAKRGFSMVEMLLAMTIFMIIMMITASAFNHMVTASGTIMKTAESNIEGVVGLEMLRKDVAQAGYGVPWTVMGTYSSAHANSMLPAVLPVGTSFTNLNDSPNGSPRPIWMLDNAGYNGSDYLAIKSTVAAMNAATKKCAIIRQTGITNTDPTPSAQFKGTDTVTVIRPTFNSLGVISDKILIGRGTYANISTATSTFRPDNPNDTFIAYGLDNGKMRAPFNRADYFIYRPTDVTAIPDICAKVADLGVQNTTGVGILYKAVMNQGDGRFTFYPLLDCVLDMQVVFGLDTTNSGVIGLHVPALNVLPVLSAADIRTQLKEVRIYILAQDGKLDRSYTYPNSSVYVGEFDSGRTFDFTAANIRDWQNYRWKIYTIVGRVSFF